MRRIPSQNPLTVSVIVIHRNLRKDALQLSSRVPFEGAASGKYVTGDNLVISISQEASHLLIQFMGIGGRGFQEHSAHTTILSFQNL